MITRHMPFFSAVDFKRVYVIQICVILFVNNEIERSFSSFGRSRNQPYLSLDELIFISKHAIMLNLY